jgi:aminoglycoside phosphotransferase (APT) family kinase protein
MSSSALIPILKRALAAAPGFAALAEARLVPLPGRGVAHDHFACEGAAIGGVEAVLRVPQLSQWGMAPERQLAYEAAAFTRAAPSGTTPRFLGTLPVQEDLPMGALVVERIGGAKPRLPQDLPALAASLARIHTLTLPPAAERAPLLVHDDPVAETLRAIREQAAFVGEAGLAPEAAAAIAAELARAESGGAAARPPPILTLTGSDTHPGNFLIEPGGRAVFVDLEKALYGNPAVDLAHATLYTSTMWDPDSAAALSTADTAAFYAAYFVSVPAPLAAAVRPWALPLRRLIWLRTLTWCVRWRVLSRSPGGWSKARLAPDHAAHIERTVADYIDPERIKRIRAGLEAERELFY